MRQFEPDWAYIGSNLLRPSLSLLVAVAVMGLAIGGHAREYKRYADLRANHVAVHEDYNALVSQRRLIDRYHRRYQQFHDLGFIGRESRLDWVETLRTTAAKQLVPRLAYTIEPQVGVRAPLGTASSGAEIQIRVSKLQLEIGLLHELDLLRFFDALQNRAPGLIKVDECTVVFEGEDHNLSSAANLSALCAAQIFSVITSDVGGEAI